MPVRKKIKLRSCSKRKVGSTNKEGMLKFTYGIMNVFDVGLITRATHSEHPVRIERLETSGLEAS